MIKDIDGKIARSGFVDVRVSPDIDLAGEIKRLIKEKNAILLAHYYQVPEIQDLADHIGDSLALAQAAAKTTADIIVFAGVHFMAETAKILNPEKKVLLPDLNAGCSLAENCPPERFREFIEKHPGHLVISYINCPVEVKAMSDIICTSSNAEKIIRSIPLEQPIIFAPDANLGKYLQHETGREMVLWDGACIVHEEFSREKILKLKEQHPGAIILAHPECEGSLLEMAGFIGSTAKLLDFIHHNDHPAFIIATEAGIIHQMKKLCPEKKIIPAPLNQYTQCACGECPYMKLNTLEKLYLCLEYEKPEIIMERELIDRSYAPLKKMLDMSL